jgi:S-formylglutathione hydrolase FrmB
LSELTVTGGARIKGEDDTWDFGTGAGFYIDATEPGWRENYKMYSYITEELPDVVFNEFPINSEKVSITGHSMGTSPNTQSNQRRSWGVDFVPSQSRKI